jgi:hypothetical protein
MSAKITVILYILVYFELAAVLIVSPWTPYWSDNLFLAYLVQRTNSPNFLITMNSIPVRAGVTALGVVNVVIGLWEAFRFRYLVRLVEDAKNDRPTVAPAPAGSTRVSSEVETEHTATLSDHRPEGQ